MMMIRFFVLLFILLQVTILFAQKDSIQAPYLRHPNFPPVKVLLADSTVAMARDQLPKKKPVMLMVFSPSCEHCQHETEDILKNIDKFKNVTILMVTWLSYKDMMDFRTAYGLAKYPNIIMGYDKDFFLPPFYDIKNLPLLAFYDKKGKLISAFSGSLPIEKVLAELEK